MGDRARKGEERRGDKEKTPRGIYVSVYDMELTKFETSASIHSLILVRVGRC